MMEKNVTVRPTKSKQKKKVKRKQLPRKAPAKQETINDYPILRFYLKSILLAVCTVAAAWFVLIYDYQDDKDIKQIVQKANDEQTISRKNKKKVENYERYAASWNYKLFHSYKWIVQINLLQNYQKINAFRKAGYTTSQYQEYKSGFDYNYLKYIKENTPYNAVILMPDQKDLETSTVQNLELKNISNKAWSYYFLHPRTLVYDQPNQPDANPIVKDVNYEKDRERITHVAIANGKGYEHLKYQVRGSPEHTVVPIDPSEIDTAHPKQLQTTNYGLIAFSLLLTFFLGLSILLLLSLKFSYMEKIGLSFLLGMGVQVLGMMLLDFISIPVQLYSIYTFSLLVIAGCWFRIRRVHDTSIRTALFPEPPFSGIAWRKINLSWLILVGLMTMILFFIGLKCLVFPPFEFDAIAGYDLMAKVLASEGTFNNSLFSSGGYAMSNTAHRLVYPPLVSGSFGYLYMSGAVTSKLMTFLFYLCLIISLYGLFRRLQLTHLNTAITLLLIMLIPELTSHASLSQTNLPQGVFTSIAVILFFIWFRAKANNTHFLYLSMLFFGCNSIIRTENALFAIVIGMILFVYTLNNRTLINLKRTLLFAGCSLIPILLWMFFLNWNGMKPYVPEAPTFDFSYDSEKLVDWWGMIWGYEKFKWSIFINKGFFALTPYLYFLTLALSTLGLPIYYVLKRNTLKIAQFKTVVMNHLVLVFITLGIFSLYSSIFYFMDYNWDSLRNVMNYSYKRGLFATMILFCFFIGSNFFTRSVFNRINEFLYR